jgi:hypothetical protein
MLPDNRYCQQHRYLMMMSNLTSSSNTGAVGNTDYPEKRNVTGFSALPGGNRYGVVHLTDFYHSTVYGGVLQRVIMINP